VNVPNKKVFTVELQSIFTVPNYIMGE